MANVETNPVPMPDLADIGAVIEYVAGAYDLGRHHPEMKGHVKMLLGAGDGLSSVFQGSPNPIAEIALMNIDRTIRGEPTLEYPDR